MGSDHVLLLSDVGRVFATGASSAGQLGIPSHDVTEDVRGESAKALAGATGLLISQEERRSYRHSSSTL